MNKKLPSLYSPKTPEDIIGPAGQIAVELKRAVKDARESDNAPLKVLFAGDAGVGKSTLANFLIGALGVDSKWSIKKYSGVDVDIEKVRDIAADLHYKDLFGAYRVIWVEEADAIPNAAQTRFKFYEVEAPAPHEIEGLLSRWVPNRRDVVNIATFACGNVRAALLDAERLMQAA